MKHRNRFQSGEIATIIALGSLLFIAITTFTSSLILKNKQTVSSKAEEKPKCDNMDWYCAGECADSSVRKIFNETYSQDGSDEWRAEKAKNSGISVDQCSSSSGGGTTSGSSESSGGSASSNCFSLSADIDARRDSEKYAFYVWVNFNSQKSGDVKLDLNGQHIAGWNGFGGGTYTYSPQWTQSYRHDTEVAVATIGKSSSFSASYTGWHRGCSDPQNLTVNCTLKVSSDGNPSVSGSGCNCKNCGSSSSSSSGTSTSTGNTSSKSNSQTSSSSNLKDTQTAGNYAESFPSATPKKETSNTTSSSTSECGGLGQKCCHDAGTYYYCDTRFKCSSVDMKCVDSTSKTTSTSISPSPTDTPTPTPTPTGLPDVQTTTDKKGTVEFFIPFKHTEYFPYYDEASKEILKNYLNISLTRSCNWWEFNCSYSEEMTVNQNEIKVVFNNVDRYYYDNGLKQANLKFSITSPFFTPNEYSHDFVFPDYYTYIYTVPKQEGQIYIDLGNHIRVVNISFEKNSNFSYLDNFDLISINPSDNNHGSSISSAKYNKQIQLVYTNLQTTLPDKIEMNVRYACGTTSSNTLKQKIITIPETDKLSSVINEVKAIKLDCL